MMIIGQLENNLMMPATYVFRDDQAHDGIHATPDHEFFKHLASTYSTNHLNMMDPQVCPRWFFRDGITNGADWYSLNGGLQVDFPSVKQTSKHK